jgi:predicted P-loop ATPase
LRGAGAASVTPNQVRAGKVRGGIGLAHAFSGTCCLDFDDLEQSAMWFFEEHGIDVHALLNAYDAVQIRSGRQNRGKLLYRLPAGIAPLITVKVPECGLELRCATRDGKTVQDVLPPTIHPTTLNAYQWGGAGDWHNLPELPPDVLAVWKLLEANVDPAREGAGVPEGDPDADPMVQHLDAGNWVRAKLRDGTRHIRCPFEHEHESFKKTGKPGTVGDCSYFPAATGGYAQGHFHCLHTTCADRTDEDFVGAVGYNPHAVYAAEQSPIVDEANTAPAWPAMVRDSKGRIEATIDNLNKALRHEGMATMRLAYDAFRDEIMFSTDQGSNWQAFKDTDYVTLRVVMERCGFKPIGRELIRDVVAKVAEDNGFDSAQVWLNEKVPAWDGVPRIDRFLTTHFGAGDSDYVRAIGRYTWTAMAGRILDPGCQADMVPVLIGDQGARKSTGVKEMAPAVDFFCEISLSDKEDDLSRKMRGTLVAEIGELRGLHSKEIEHIKQFVTRRHEIWTPKFKEFTTRFPRRLVFIGTTNQAEFLADETGNRRWLPTPVGQVDVEAITRDRIQLWAEARDAFLMDGVAWSDAERLARNQHHKHMISDIWEEPIREWIESQSASFYRLNDVMQFALNLNINQVARREELRVGRILRLMGLEKHQRREGEKVIKVWAKRCAF